MSHDLQATELLKITSRLIGVLEREIEMLRAMKPAELQSLQQDKIVLTAAYEAKLRALKDQPALLEALAPELRAELTGAVERFERTLAENERSLRAAKLTTERVLQVIADEVERQYRDSHAYSSNGGQAKPSRVMQRQAVSVAIDERF